MVRKMIEGISGFIRPCEWCERVKEGMKPLGMTAAYHATTGLAMRNDKVISIRGV